MAVVSSRNFKRVPSAWKGQQMKAVKPAVWSCSARSRSRWPTMGPEVGQVALRFGGNDFGSAMIEENVVSQAGAVFKLGAEDIERYVRGAGFTPRRRNMRYELLPTSAAAGYGVESCGDQPLDHAANGHAFDLGDVTDLLR